MMDIKEVKVGMLVVMPKRPEWGPGKVLEINGSRVTAYFVGAPKTDIGSAHKVLDLARGAVLEPAASQSHPWLDNLPMRDGKLDLVRPPLTIDQAVEAFLQSFPLGFQDPAYLGDRKSGERNYKWEAHLCYLELLGNGKGERLLAQGDLEEVKKQTRKVLDLLNLTHSFEKVAFKDGMKDDDAAQAFFEALFALLDAGEPERGPFDRLIDALEALPAPGSKVASWPNLTVLPYIARPDAFMLLKHDESVFAADLLAFDLRYEPRLNWTTYERLMTMGRLLAEELKARGEPALVPADFIDVQSFR